jgi:hypothetical protein
MKYVEIPMRDNYNSPPSVADFNALIKNIEYLKKQIDKIKNKKNITGKQKTIV